MTLDELEPASRLALHELALRLQHDVGKYVTLQARWLPADADVGARIEAARADLLRTARGPAGERDAMAVAEPFVAALVGEAALEEGGSVVDLAEDPAVAEVLAAVAEVGRLLAPLAEPGAADVVDDAFAAARRLREACRALVAASRPPEPSDPDDVFFP